MITDGNEKFHYLSVQSMSRLVLTGAKYKSKYYICKYCLYPFRKEDQLKEHMLMCRQHQSQQIRYPTPGKDNVLKFISLQNFIISFQYRSSFITILNVFLEKNYEDHSVTHIPSGFCALTVSIFEEHDYKINCYSGENVMDEFYNYINHEEQ